VRWALGARRAYTSGVKNKLVIAGTFLVVELLLLLRVLARSGMLGLTLFVLGSAAVGLFVVRTYAPAAISAFRAGKLTAEAEDTSGWEALFGVLAGVMLVVPGVLTDIGALLLLLPPVRAIVAHSYRGRAGPLVRGASALAGSLPASLRRFLRREP
jgi:UPF0716 protein FxsA